MFFPCRPPHTSDFRPLALTRTVSFTRGLPQGQDADILLLACGDVAKILFTIHSEKGFPPRKLDITYCDEESGVIARNVLLFTLLVDGINAHSAWDVYFHLRIDIDSKNLIEGHTQKLISLSNNIHQWNEGHYGSILKFCDAHSTANRSQDVAKKSMCNCGGTNYIVKGLASTAPLLLAAGLSPPEMEIPQVANYYWKHGNFSREPAMIPNPTFFEAMSTYLYIHPNTDPIIGFHLATALAKLAPTSPLRLDKDNDEIFDSVNAAKTQFREWVAAFRDFPQHNITLRFAVSNPLSFGHGLQSISTLQSGSKCLFRRQLDAAPLEFDSTIYATAPTRFDVIDTSNISDYTATLNVLLAAAPLLKASASSTLWTETIGRTKQTAREQFDSVLCGHTPTMSLLLGLSPADYWTNATTMSDVDEQLLNNAGEWRVQSRLAWKSSTIFSQQFDDAMTLNVEPNALAMVVFEVYARLFDNEDPCTYGETGVQKYAYFNRLLQMIDQDDQAQFSRRYYRQELAVQLHLQGLHTESSLIKKVSPRPEWGGINAWKHIPEVVCVIIMVPKQQVDILYGSELSRNTPPTLEGVLKELYISGLYASVHVVFGSVETLGSREAEDFSINIQEDPLSWEGNSSLLASFYVPSSDLQINPKDIKVGLRVQPQGAVVDLTEPTSDMTLCMTALDNTSQVFVTKYGPGMSGCPLENKTTTDSTATSTGTNINLPTATQVTTNFKDNKIVSLCSRVDFSSSQQGAKLLAERVSIELQQTSPSSIDVIFGEKALIYPLSFPAPVLKQAAKTRIARTSGYVEVIAPLADPLTSEPSSSFIFPLGLGESSIPVALNGQHVNLDLLPILDVDQSYKFDNRWLSVLASYQLSSKERRLRRSETEPPTLRMNFKESLFTIFMLASGLQGRHTGLFALQHPRDGNQALIFVRAIRINDAEGSVVADAAVIPFTREMLESDELRTFLLGIRELEIRAITVSDEELALWKHVLPAFAERCRTWSHGPNCEYKKSGATIPLSTNMGEPFMCSCGNGKLPERFMSLPEWDDVAAKHAVRIAISPTFSVRLVGGIDIDDQQTFVEMMRMHGQKCRSCKATTGKNGAGLMKCGRCKGVMYCSAACQRRDWKTHRAVCKAQDGARTEAFVRPWVCRRGSTHGHRYVCAGVSNDLSQVYWF
ncbi:uncharacterized protein F4822DRAFT_432655 [Hypoxylon trugodes]|uniref:uncharacterized protein n=1 Tax=Hypoxylon trugodes TaxID=326681 RepID=UPI00218F6D0A|nr:uncharacterized protein F4822DRAFT_432655 [Hypoxylon trugodes]KAI1385797.1 hypothetical protein F4822DRAFT_432655 [Hypoxylon trugodes]